MEIGKEDRSSNREEYTEEAGKERDKGKKKEECRDKPYKIPEGSSRDRERGKRKRDRHREMTRHTENEL